MCVREFDWNGSEFDSSVPDWLTEEAVASGAPNAALSFRSAISSDSVMLLSHQKKYLDACLRGRLSLREASSCDRQFILNHGQSLRVVEVPETSEKFRIHNVTRSIKYSKQETSGSSKLYVRDNLQNASHYRENKPRQGEQEEVSRRRFVHYPSYYTKKKK